MIQVPSRFTEQKVLFESATARSLKEATAEAVARNADLCGADLRNADLCGANLRYADLYGANLRGADLHGADLGGAKLRHADLRGANLGDANLHGADLYGANLRDADLRYADLRYACLCGANLNGANLNDLAKAQLSIVPECGSFAGWKQCRDKVLVKLEIPATARRSNATGRKCRAERALVIEVIGAEVGISRHDPACLYRVGEVVHCNNWDDNRWNECSGGIHFFMTRIEAENY